jgi:hypothetical protein
MRYREQDLVVWNGIITYFELIKPLLGTGDLIRFADHEEILLYNQKL